MPTIAQIKAELKAKKIKGITGKNKAQLLAMLYPSKSPAVAPAPAPAPAHSESAKHDIFAKNITKPVEEAMEHLIKEVHSEKKIQPIIIRKTDISEIVNDFFEGSEEPNDDMTVYDATHYIDKLIKELKKSNGKFMAYGGSFYGGNGSAMEAIIDIVADVLAMVDKHHLIDIQKKDVYADDYEFGGDENKYDKYVKARLDIDEEMGQVVPEFFAEYTTSIKPMEGTDKEKLFYKNNLIKNLEEAQKQIQAYNFY